MVDPFLSALDASDGLPEEQSLANAAIIVIFAYLVPLLTMEINYFRLAAYKSWRRRNRGHHKTRADAGVDAASGAAGAEEEEEEEGERGGDDVSKAGGNSAADLSDVRSGNVTNIIDDDDAGSSSSSSSAVAHLLKDIARASHRSVLSRDGSLPGGSLAPTPPSLQKAYAAIRAASCQAIASSLLVYTLTAVGVSLNTRGLDSKVIAVIEGGSQFLAAFVVFIVSAKVPQWIGVYHQGHIRLVKCSSNYSQQFEKVDLDDDADLRRLRSNVRLGVWFHFAKFYIVAMPFYSGVRPGTIPLSVLAGAALGFVLMWAVFVVHEKYIRHRNTVSFLTIFLLSILSSLTFTRGVAWMQVVWKWNILRDEDALMVISFFAWLAICVAVHGLFIWHTLRVEEGKGAKSREGEGDAVVDGADVEGSMHASGRDTPDSKGRSKSMRRIASYESYSSFVFDPRIHFKDVKCQFSEHPDVEDEFTDDLTPEVGLPLDIDCDNDHIVHDDEDLGCRIESPVTADGDVVMEFDNDEIVGNDEIADNTRPDPVEAENLNPRTHAARSSHLHEDPAKGKKGPACREVFACFSPEYQRSSRFWKAVVWIKVAVVALSYLLCLYFVIVCIGATSQIQRTRDRLPAVQAALYDHMDEGPVCAFDNRGADSDITTFDDKEAAHAAGYLVVHCGACGACSTWENLIIEYTTRNTMAASANQCAKEALFGGGDEALHACLMEPPIGFGDECALCWMEDILCTKAHCAFIFLQSQMINNVGNFAVGEDEITSASCEEANCEVGQFVPCSGATRRRMNIVSSISRPGDQQCGIVDVRSWEDLFFGSGFA